MTELIEDWPITRTEQRRSKRFPVVIPIEAKWSEASGQAVRENAQAREVNAQGGLLDMKTSPGFGRLMEITNLLSGQATEARVVAVRSSKDAFPLKVAVELVVPNETFWGVNFQLRRTTAELVKIEEGIKSGGVEPNILREFRDAVDYVRKTAWAVQEWQERQLQKHDPQTVLPLLTSERIRRATQLNKAITMDLTTHQLTRESPGIEEFFRATEALYQRVAHLFKGRQT